MNQLPYNPKDKKTRFNQQCDEKLPQKKVKKKNVQNQAINTFHNEFTFVRFTQYKVKLEAVLHDKKSSILQNNTRKNSKEFGLIEI